MYLRILLIFATIYMLSAEETEENWPESVLNVVQQHFSANVILVFNCATVEFDRNGLLLIGEDSFTELVKKLSANWTVIIADQKNKALKMEIQGRWVSKARQVIAIVDEEFLESNRTLSETVSKWRLHNAWNDDGKILIVAKTGNGEELAKNIFQTLWIQAKIVNVVLLARKLTNLQVYTWFPYNTHCTVNVIPLGIYSKNRKLPIFMGKYIKNANKCLVSGTAWPNVPYVFPPNKTGQFYDGLDLRIFKEFSRHLNFTATVQAIPLELQKALRDRQIAVNGTPVGPMGMLARGETDIMLWGRILSYERTLYVDAILPTYFFDDLVWVGPMPLRSPKWKSVFLVFTQPVWFTILVVFLLSSSTVYAVLRMNAASENTQFSNVVFLMLATELSNSVPPPKQLTRALFRIFQSCFLFYIITVNALYSSGLYNVLSNGLKVQDINTPEGAAEAGMSVVILPPFRTFVRVNKPLLFKYIREKHLVTWKFDRSECKYRAVKFKDCFYLSTALEAAYDINYEYMTDVGDAYLRIYPGRFIPANPVFYMTKNHPLAPAFSRLVQRLIESGWIFREAKRLIDDARHHRKIAMVVREEHQEEARKELTLEKLLGAYMAFGINAAVAILVLVVEILIKRLRRIGGSRGKDITGFPSDIPGFRHCVGI